MKSFSIKASLLFGWQKTKKEFPFFLKVFTIISITHIVSSILITGANDTAPLLSFLFKLISWILYMMYMLGLLRIGLLIEAGKKARIMDLVSGRELLINFILGSLLYMLAVVSGLLFFIVPGIIFAIKLRFFPFFMLEKNLDVVGSFERSSNVTRGHIVHLFLFYAGMGILNLFGAAFFLVGLLVTVPVSLIATVHVYRKLAD